MDGAGIKQLRKICLRKLSISVVTQMQEEVASLFDLKVELFKGFAFLPPCLPQRGRGGSRWESKNSQVLPGTKCTKCDSA